MAVTIGMNGNWLWLGSLFDGDQSIKKCQDLLGISYTSNLSDGPQNKKRKFKDKHRQNPSTHHLFENEHQLAKGKKFQEEAESSTIFSKSVSLSRAEGINFGNYSIVFPNRSTSFVSEPSLYSARNRPDLGNFEKTTTQCSPVGVC
jgi:hypothetical protein